MVRIVKMTMATEHTERFMEIFTERRSRIAGFTGCEKVELIRSGNVFFTYSVWKHPDDLENYRRSDLFIETWALVKPLFAAKAEAWSGEIF